MALRSKTSDKKQKLTISQSQLDNVQSILNEFYGTTFISVMQDASKMGDIVNILTDSKRFAQFPTYHNRSVAVAYAREIVDLGVIDHLLQENKDITDVGFNGRFLTVETNSSKYTYGLKPGQQQITQAYIRKIVGRFALREGSEGKSFSKGAPIFNGFSNNIRISATHESLAPDGMTMSLRISKPSLALTHKNWNNFAGEDVYNLLMLLVKAHANIVISGETGTGKTELLKLLVGAIPFEDKIIMIEDVAETHLPQLYPKKDIYSWITTAGGDVAANKQHGVTISDHIKNALRNNPKWLMISETRGAEAYEMFQAVLSGHNLITTLHSISNQAVPRRFVGMSSIGYPNVNEELLEGDFLSYIHLGVHIRKKVVNGRVFRFLDELAEFVPRSKEHPNGINVLYTQRFDKEGIYHWTTGTPSPKLLKLCKDELDFDLQWPVREGTRKAVDPKTGEPMDQELAERKNK